MSEMILIVVIMVFGSIASAWVMRPKKERFEELEHHHHLEEPPPAYRVVSSHLYDQEREGW